MVWALPFFLVSQIEREELHTPNPQSLRPEHQLEWSASDPPKPPASKRKRRSYKLKEGLTNQRLEECHGSGLCQILRNS